MLKSLDDNKYIEKEGKGRNIGFVSTRFAGIDGVSLESAKWGLGFERQGWDQFYFAGELDRDPKRSLFVPEAHFKHDEIRWINEQVFIKKNKGDDVSERIHKLQSHLKGKLYQFIDDFNLELLVVENALSIPMNLPLGLALNDVIAETHIPTIAHHHDFDCERGCFLDSTVEDYLKMTFPPKLPNIAHVVINSAAQQYLIGKDIKSTIVPNVLDFENPPVINTNGFRDDIGLKEDDIMILQPTRVVERKGIENAVNLVRYLGDSIYKLVVSHDAGDEGPEYACWLEGYADEQGVDLRFVKTKIADPLNGNGEGYSLWDIYSNADFVTYPSKAEGFGNAFLEAIYFNIPMMVRRYPIFIKDIEPKGFDIVSIDKDITEQTVLDVKKVLGSAAEREKMVNHNYKTAAKHYSYAVLDKGLGAIMQEILS